MVWAINTKFNVQFKIHVLELENIKIIWVKNGIWKMNIKTSYNMQST